MSDNTMCKHPEGRTSTFQDSDGPIQYCHMCGALGSDNEWAVPALTALKRLPNEIGRVTLGPNGTTYRVIDGELHRIINDLPPELRTQEVPTWNLKLDKYQRDNLAWLIGLIGHFSFAPAEGGVEPFTFANTGDWVGEIGFMLRPEDGKDIKPNMTRETMVDLLQQREKKRTQEASADGLLKKAIRYLNLYHLEDGALPWDEHNVEVTELVELMRPASAPCTDNAKCADCEVMRRQVAIAVLAQEDAERQRDEANSIASRKIGVVDKLHERIEQLKAGVMNPDNPDAVLKATRERVTHLESAINAVLRSVAKREPPDFEALKSALRMTGNVCRLDYPTSEPPVSITKYGIRVGVGHSGDANNLERMLEEEHKASWNAAIDKCVEILVEDDEREKRLLVTLNAIRGVCTAKADGK